MRKTRLALAVTALSAVAFAAPAGASCAPGASEGEVLQVIDATGSEIYQTATGGGVRGDIGYIEASATTEGGRLHGSTSDGAVNGDGAVGADGSASLCVNDTQVL